MAITSIIATSNKVPGVYMRVSLGVGQRSSGDATRYVVIFANKNSTGTAGTGAVETEIDIFSEDDARTYGGNGSEAYWMCREAIRANPTVAIKLILITESAGTAATGTLVFTGPATAAGTVEVSVMGMTIQVAYASGDANTAVATAVNAAIVAQTDWPVTSTVAVATVTVAARHKGPRGNHLALRGRIIDGAGVTVTGPALGYLTAGATSDTPQNCLDIELAVQRHYLVAPYSDATNLAMFKTHLDAEDEPANDHRKQCVFGSLDTVANTTTVATGLNLARMQCAWMEGSDNTPAMMAAALASYRSGKESTDPAYNYNGDVLAPLLPHFRIADRPLNTELVSALNNGITPLASTNSGEVYIVRSVTCRSQDASAHADYRVLDTSKVTVPDFIAEDIQLAMEDRFAHFKASNDPAEGESPPPNVATPSMVRDLIFERLNSAEDAGMLALGSVLTNEAATVVNLNTTAVGRFDFVAPIDVIEWFNQGAGDIRQIG